MVAFTQQLARIQNTVVHIIEGDFKPVQLKSVRQNKNFDICLALTEIHSKR